MWWHDLFFIHPTLFSKECRSVRIHIQGFWYLVETDLTGENLINLLLASHAMASRFTTYGKCKVNDLDGWPTCSYVVDCTNDSCTLRWVVVKIFGIMLIHKDIPSLLTKQNNIVPEMLYSPHKNSLSVSFSCKQFPSCSSLRKLLLILLLY